MAIPLSRKTRKLVQSLFEEDEAQRISRRLIAEASDNLVDHERSSTGGMERIRFSIIRLLHEGHMAEDDVFRVTASDWRDLLMCAEHGELDAHLAWAKRVLRVMKHS